MIKGNALQNVLLLLYILKINKVVKSLNIAINKLGNFSYLYNVICFLRCVNFLDFRTQFDLYIYIYILDVKFYC